MLLVLGFDLSLWVGDPSVPTLGSLAGEELGVALVNDFLLLDLLALRSLARVVALERIVDGRRWEIG